MIHKIELTNDILHGSFSKNYKPIITINSGDTLHLTTPDIQWGYSPSREIERTIYTSREKEERQGHSIVGPIAVEGAKPGMVLEVRVNDLVPGWYGRNWAGGKKAWQNDKLGITDAKQVQVDWALDSERMTGTCTLGERKFHVGLQPFMGLMGVAPAEEGIHPTAPPRSVGGNIDCKELIRGTSLFLPIAVEGALFSVGDGHALQGDGEVSGTAIECPMDHVDLTFILHEEMNLKNAKG